MTLSGGSYSACPRESCLWWPSCGPTLRVPCSSSCSCPPCDCPACVERADRARALRHREETGGQLVMAA